ncbi:peptidylprolyl isomerase [Paenibacillus sp. DMB20]|uniref:peptidylprolyl isomerase n=1 Tax=Paenibacillus sp. DMB20 TaxID=1642570 RepID=UPI002E1002F0
MTMDNLKEQTKMQLEITKLLGDKVKVTDDEIKKTYDQYKDSFATPEQVRASHILVDTKEEAEKIIKQLKDGADFAAIAKEKNEDATKETGGDLDFFPKGKMDPAFEEAAFKLKKGEISSEPVKSSFGYHVIKVTDRKEATNPTFEDKKRRYPQTACLLQSKRAVRRLSPRVERQSEDHEHPRKKRMTKQTRKQPKRRLSRKKIRNDAVALPEGPRRFL